MIDRWYGLCYSIVDFIDRGEINSKKGSIQDLFKKLEEKYQEVKAKSAPAPNNKQLLAALVNEFYGVDLKVFHKSLFNHIIKKYKSRWSDKKIQKGAQPPTDMER